MPVEVHVADDDSPKMDDAPLPIASLRERREAIRSTLYYDLQVPRWEAPEIWVRFDPIKASRADQVIQARMDSKDDERGVLLNADLLASSCREIWASVPGDDTRYSLNVNGVIGVGPLTRFDPALAAALGLPDGSKAVDVVRALYWTDGDLIAAANALAEWSGKKGREADEVFIRP